MKKILWVLSLLTIFTFAEAQQLRRLYIHHLQVKEKNPKQKPWDAFDGKPDLVISVYQKREGQWQLAATSPISKDSLKVDVVWNTGVDIALDTVVKVVVADKDLRKDDNIGEHVLGISPYQFYAPQLTERSFAAVSSFAYFLSSERETDAAIRQFNMCKALVGGWIGHYLQPQNKLHITLQFKENGLGGLLQFEQEKGSSGAYYVECSLTGEQVVIKGTQWKQKPSGYELCTMRGKLDGALQKIEGELFINEQQKSTGHFAITKDNRQYVYLESSPVVLQYFQITDKYTIIHFVLPQRTRIGIYPAGNPKTMYLLDATGKKYKLLTYEGISTVPQYDEIEQFTCYFERLDDNVHLFHCLEAEKEIRDNSRDEKFWTWENIPVRR